MDMDFEVNMNEYLPLRDVVFNTLRKAILKRRTEAGRTADGDPACQQAWSKPHPDP